MKIKLWLTFTDGQDGSYYVTIHNEKEEALERLNRTEDQMNNGNTYEDGYMSELDIEIENGKLVKPITFSVE